MSIPPFGQKGSDSYIFTQDFVFFVFLHQSGYIFIDFLLTSFPICGLIYLAYQFNNSKLRTVILSLVLINSHRKEDDR